MWRLLLLLLFAGSAHAAEVLHLYNWNNYISEETVARFEAQCNCRVVQDYYSDNEEMLAKLAAGATGYDIERAPKAGGKRAILQLLVEVPVEIGFFH
mgnify:CR=1 FL=1